MSYDQYLCKIKEIKKLKIYTSQATKSIYKNPSRQQECGILVRASYVISDFITKHSKRFREGDFVKEYVVKATEILCAKKVFSEYFIIMKRWYRKN